MEFDINDCIWIPKHRLLIAIRDEFVYPNEVSIKGRRETVVFDYTANTWPMMKHRWAAFDATNMYNYDLWVFYNENFDIGLGVVKEKPNSFFRKKDSLKTHFLYLKEQ